METEPYPEARDITAILHRFKSLRVQEGKLSIFNYWSVDK